MLGRAGRVGQFRESVVCDWCWIWRRVWVLVLGVIGYASTKFWWGSLFLVGVRMGRWVHLLLPVASDVGVDTIFWLFSSKLLHILSIVSWWGSLDKAVVVIRMGYVRDFRVGWLCFNVFWVDELIVCLFFEKGNNGLGLNYFGN